MKDYIFTSESITEGHADKICDSIADAILDEALRQDPYSNMAVEATIKDDFVLIYGEADTKAHIDYETIAKNVIRKIGGSPETRKHLENLGFVVGGKVKVVQTIGGNLMGIVGMLIFIPIVSVLYALFREVVYLKLKKNNIKMKDIQQSGK